MRGRLSHLHVAHVMTVTYGKEHTHISTSFLARNSPEVRLGILYRYMKAEGAHSEEFHMMSAQDARKLTITVRVLRAGPTVKSIVRPDPEHLSIAKGAHLR